MPDDKVVRLPISRRGPPAGGGPPEGIDGRVTRVETRIDEIARRLETIDGRLSSLDDNLARLPSKEFLATTVIAVSGISLAAALAFAALTFNIADHAARTTQQAEQAKPSANPAAPQPQPIVIVLPSSAGVPQPLSPAQPALPSPKPAPPP